MTADTSPRDGSPDPWHNPVPVTLELETLVANYLWGKGLEYVLELAEFIYELEY